MNQPLTVFIEVAGPIQWRPSYTSLPFDFGKRGRFKRICWFWFAISWHRYELPMYHRAIRSNLFRWADDP